MDYVANDYKTEFVSVDALRPHPQNYLDHPDDQLAHIEASIRKNGFYKNIIVARDVADGETRLTILCGHGTVKASRMAGMTVVPALVYDINPFGQQAMSILVGDNEIARLAMVNDRRLTDTLKAAHDANPENLKGMGYDPMQLKARVMMTRTRDEIKDKNAAGQWVGMPAHVDEADPPKLVISFDSEEDREKLLELINVKTINRKSIGANSTTWSVRWPDRERRDLTSLGFVEAKDEEPTLPLDDGDVA